jgi:hypothetical protein
MFLRLTKVVCPALILASLCFDPVTLGSRAASKVARAHDSLNPQNDKWLSEQKNRNGANCCSVADGHILNDEDVRTTGGTYEYRARTPVGNVWVPVPAYALISGHDNPYGKPIAWYTVRPDNYAVNTWCFIPGTLI